MESKPSSDTKYNELKIKVGIKTVGKPVMTKSEDSTIVHNLLIGDGFHWESTIEADLPGEVSEYGIDGNEITEADRTITLVNQLPIETYLECVVGSEMNPNAPMEFLKAHAVISRSWALGKVLGSHKYDNSGYVDRKDCLIGWDDNEGHQGFHVCSDDHCQRYQGRQPIDSVALQAIRETGGEVLISTAGESSERENQADLYSLPVVDARFSKCCGGRTEIFSTCWQDERVAGIESFEDPWCNLSALPESSRNSLLSSILKDYDLDTQGYGFRWMSEISKTDIRANLKKHFGMDVGEITSVVPLRRGPSGRVSLLRIHGSEGTMDMGKELWIRRLLSPSHLYSSAFEAEDRGDKIILHGRGWGHGAGLCQIGAANMAAHGHDYREILDFYYPGTVLKRL